MPSPKDILLINPWIYDFTAYDFWAKPLGLLYVAAVLKRNPSFRLSFIDCLDRDHPKLPKVSSRKPDGRGPYPKEEVPKPAVLKVVPRKYSRYGIPVQLFIDELKRIPPPDIVMITCTMTYWYPGVQTVVDLIRKRFGAVPVILGGIYASLMSDHAQRETGADYVCTGGAEDNLQTLLKEVLGDDAFPLELRPDLPLWPDYSLLRDRANLPVITSRGCPYSCSFCVTPLLFPQFQQYSPSSVINLIEYLARSHRTKNIAFYDDALLLNKKNHIIPILEGLLQKNLALSFHTPNGLHVKEIDIELATLLKRADFASLFLSQESFDKNFLAESCPKVEGSDLETALFYLEEAGYSRSAINVYLIVGLPDQDVAGVREAIQRVKELGARPRLAYYSPVPNTPDWRKAVDRGYLKDGDDPLLHNKLTFPYLWGNVSPEDFRTINALLNKS
jgi:radical SAM superfamily enzyme YgiQ (UPF0313 family)